MGFKNNYEQVNEDFSLKPEGDYECIITKIEEKTTRNGAKGINFTLTIRKDVAQKYKGACLFYTIWRKKEPSELDAQVGGYNFSQLMSVGRAVGLPDGKDYDSLSQYLEELAGGCVRATMKHEEWNDKTYERVTYLNPPKAAPSRIAAPQSLWVEQAAQTAQTGIEDFEDIIGDDGVPF